MYGKRKIESIHLFICYSIRLPYQKIINKNFHSGVHICVCISHEKIIESGNYLTGDGWNGILKIGESNSGPRQKRFWEFVSFAAYEYGFIFMKSLFFPVILFLKNEERRNKVWK